MKYLELKLELESDQKRVEKLRSIGCGMDIYETKREEVEEYIVKSVLNSK